MDVFSVHHGKARNSVSPGDGILVKYPRLPPIVPVDELTDRVWTPLHSPEAPIPSSRSAINGLNV
uniref:Uncharacterized protein n=1 Tax=Magallana gigas TaxID=29159 RepID=K1QMV0_MAGGI